MDPVTLLRAELKGAHDLLEAVMVDVTSETADWMPPGRANPVGATYAHVVISEDRTIQGMLRHRHPLKQTPETIQKRSPTNRQRPRVDHSQPSPKPRP